MKIPRILHQTWKDDNIPEDFRKMAASWRKMHADWEYRFWTDETNRDFIRQHFPYFLEKYDSYPTNIQRVDAVRYFVLYKCGGIYVDMDFECLANITPLIGNSECVFGKEPSEHCLIHQKSIIISNAFMGAAPGCHFLGLLCTELENDHHITDHPNDNILETTGPFMLSRLYNSYEKKDRISLLDADLIYPLTKEDLSGWNEGMEDHMIQDKLKLAYGIHHYAGTWWKK
jgi:inositol phosphorylceramide mannosyltransferase catalytic subunit